MRFARFLVPLIFVGSLATLPAAASHLVTGNGYGFAVVSPETGTVTKFYAHPYSFLGPDPKNALSEGIETANFIHVLGWGTQNAQVASSEYLQDSHIIRASRDHGEGFCFMPFGLQHAALVISWEPGNASPHDGGIQVEWSHPVMSRKVVRMYGTDMQLLKFNDAHESLLLIPLGRKLDESTPSQRTLADNSAWALVSLESDSKLEQTASDFNRWRAGSTPKDLVRREIAEVERWRTDPRVTFASEEERHLWRQSEVMLRIAQSREPDRPGRNGNGLIVASLPDGVWFTPWVREMAYATMALVRMGHKQEARAALLAYFNAHPTGKMRAETRGADYQVSVVRYFGNGEEEPFFTQEGSTNIEFDDWGLALWALGEYLRQFDDPTLLTTATYRGPLYDAARDFVAKPLISNLESYDTGAIVTADTSIWEERQKDKKHFAWSTALAIVGLQDFANVASRAGDQATSSEISNQVALLRRGFKAAFIRAGKLHGTLEDGVKNDIDGALLAIINFGLVTDPAIVRDAVERMELLKVDSGGYRRVRSTYTDPAIFEYWYERQEFLFVDFSLVEVDWQLGRDAEAAAMLKRIVHKAAADHNIIPEMYVAVPCRLFPGIVGDPTGAIPMVGYGAGEFILHVLERQGRLGTN
jgi:GH15 family glucan-1,4-alpha-glucosidase